MRHPSDVGRRNQGGGHGLLSARLRSTMNTEPDALTKLMARVGPAAKPEVLVSSTITRPDMPESELDGPDGLHLTSMGNAERFLRDHREDVLWVEGPTINSSGAFYCWDGQRWQADNARAMLLAKETVCNLNKLVASAI